MCCCHDDVLPWKLKKRVKIWLEIDRTGGDKGDVDVMNVDGDVVDEGCNR